MNPAIPAFLFPYMFLGTLATVTALLFGLNRSLSIAHWPTTDRIKAVWIGLFLLGGLYAAADIPARLGLYHQPSKVPLIQFGLLAPIALVLLLFFLWRPFRRTIEAIPQQWLVGIQLYRILGLIFLILYAMDKLPGAFAISAGVGDVFVGLAAPSLALASMDKSVNADKLVHRWNLFGLADLTVALITGFLSSPSPLQILALDHPNQLVTQYPLAIVPIFLVPIAILLHLASLHRLRQSRLNPSHSAPSSFVLTETS
jgi:purine-cytosine permease-like protein